MTAPDRAEAQARYLAGLSPGSGLAQTDWFTDRASRSIAAGVSACASSEGLEAAADREIPLSRTCKKPRRHTDRLASRWRCRAEPGTDRLPVRAACCRRAQSTFRHGPKR